MPPKRKLTNNKKPAESQDCEGSYYLRSKRFKTSTDDETPSRDQSFSPDRITSKSKCTLMNLPPEMLRHIFQFINFETLAKVLRLVNKQCMQMAQSILNVSFLNLDKRLLTIKNILKMSLEHIQEDAEIKCMCKLLNVLELVHFHYNIVKSVTWRYITNKSRLTHSCCMYGGSILDICYRLCRHFMECPDKIYSPLIVREYLLPLDVLNVVQQAKKFALCFDRVTEMPINKSVFTSASKVVDILDCAIQATRQVLHRKIIGNTVFLKLRYFFSNSWFTALTIQEDKSKDWQEQMRLLYMRIRRIVVSHTEMNLEYSQFERENRKYRNEAFRTKSPVNSVYTGFGEVEDKFFFYGVMNKGAYISKFRPADGPTDNEIDPENPHDANSEPQTYLGLHITVTIRCPVQLAPLLTITEINDTTNWSPTEYSRDILDTDDEDNVPKRIRGLFDMRIQFECPSAAKARLPTVYMGHIRGRR